MVLFESPAHDLGILASQIGVFIAELSLSSDLAGSQRDLENIWASIEAVGEMGNFNPTVHGPMIGSVTELYNFAERSLDDAIRASFRR